MTIRKAQVHTRTHARTHGRTHARPADEKVAAAAGSPVSPMHASHMLSLERFPGGAAARGEGVGRGQRARPAHCDSTSPKQRWKRPRTSTSTFTQLLSSEIINLRSEIFVLFCKLRQLLGQ